MVRFIIIGIVWVFGSFVKNGVGVFGYFETVFRFWGIVEFFYWV